MNKGWDFDLNLNFAKQHILSAKIGIRHDESKEEILFQLDKALDQLAQAQRTKWYAEHAEPDEPEETMEKRRWWFW